MRLPVRRRTDWQPGQIRNSRGGGMLR